MHRLWRDRSTAAGCLLVAVLVTTALLISGPSPAQASAPNCPPDACVDVSEATALKAEVKRQMASRGVPPRLQTLIDQLPNCVACIRAAELRVVVVMDREAGLADQRRFGRSDPYNIRSSVGDTMYASTEWSQRAEAKARRDLAAGRIQAFHITVAEGPCICCPETREAAERWLAAGGALRPSPTQFDNRYAFSFSDPERDAALPRDLYELDPSLRALAFEDPPAINTRLPVTFPPVLREAQALCPECRALAARRNALARQHNELREQAAELYIEGGRLLRRHIWFEGETVRAQGLVDPPGEENDGVAQQNDIERVRADAFRLTEANEIIRQSNELRAQAEALQPQIDALDAELAACDQLPCAAEQPIADANLPDPEPTLDADARIARSFAAFVGLSFKSSWMASNVDYGGLRASGSALVPAAGLSAGLMAYPFAGIPLYVSAEGMLFAGPDGSFYTVTFHPGPGNDTTAKGRAVWAARVAIGYTLPLQSGCISRAACYLVDLEGGLVFEGFRTRYITNESGGGGIRNVFTFNETHTGVSLGAALSVPLCAVMDIVSGPALAPFARLNLFPGDSDPFAVTTPSFNLSYAGAFDIDAQAELGLRLIMPFGGSR